MSLVKFFQDDYSIYYISSLSNISKIFETQKIIPEENYINIFTAIFEIRTPFLMDGEAQKLQMKIGKSDETIFNVNNKRVYQDYFIQKNKKRKVHDVLSPEELNNIAYVKRAFLEIQNSSKYKNYFNFIPLLKDISENNRISRVGRDMFINAGYNDMHLLNIDGVNPASEPCVHEYNGHRYLVPPNCHYINGDVLKLDSFLRGKKFDLVVLDPPWSNKHVRRRKKAKGLVHSYKMMSVEEIMKIPLTTILSPVAYVLIWITNSPKILQEFLQFLKLWDLEVVTTWYWLKVTKTGEPVSHLDASLNGKLPYEKLVISRRRGNTQKFPSQLENLIFCSIPCSVHSHKPPLNELLEECLGVNENWNCLELFARSLTPNWTSIGNEVLKFQDLTLLQSFKENS